MHNKDFGMILQPSSLPTNQNLSRQYTKYSWRHYNNISYASYTLSSEFTIVLLNILEEPTTIQ